MSVWSTITADPDAFIGIVTAILGAFGVNRWRSKTRESTLQEIDKWAQIAARMVVMAINSGELVKDEDARADFLKRFHALAAAAGVMVTSEYEARAYATGVEVISRTGQTMLLREAQRLREKADHFLHRLDSMPISQRTRRESWKNQKSNPPGKP